MLLDQSILVAAAWSWEILTSGGAPGIALLSVLVALSIAALALAVEQFTALRTGRLAPEGVAATVKKRLEAGDLAGARRACEERGLIGRVLATGLEEADQPAAKLPSWAEVEKTIEDALAAESARMLRRIEYLALIGNLAPMVGLLGTVVGMIFAFREVADTQGAATAGELASGIYQALVTTVGGLLVAIPSLAAFAVLRGRVEAIAAEVAVQAESATRPLKRALRGAAPASPPPSRGA